MTTALDIAREVFPDYSEDELDYVIWNRTGWPVFWPKRFRSTETALRTQLKAVRRAFAGLKEGETLCQFCNRKSHPSYSRWPLCKKHAFMLDEDSA